MALVEKHPWLWLYSSLWRERGPAREQPLPAAQLHLSWGGQEPPKSHRQ